MATTGRTEGVVCQPLLNVLQMSSVCAALTPDVESGDRHMTYGAVGRLSLTALAQPTDLRVEGLSAQTTRRVQSGRRLVQCIYVRMRT